MRSIIRSTGSYLPEKILTNKDLEGMVDTSDEWIFQRSGIRQRHIASDEQGTSDLAIEAARMALSNADDLRAEDIDAVIVATTTPDQRFPSVAVRVQAALGISPGIAFDVQAVCTGFVYALSVADSFIRNGNARRVLVIGAEKMSSIVDWKDRTTCVLFADGAGAVIMEASEDQDGVVSTHLYADGRYADILQTNNDNYIEMQGREVFKHAVTCMADVVEEAIESNGLKSSDIDWLVPHQANIRIIESTAKKLNMPMEQVVVTVDKHGNTSAASIPLALHDSVASGKIKRGQLLLLEAMGGGLTWGSALIRF